MTIIKTKSFIIREFTLDDVASLARSFGVPEILRAVRGRSGTYTRADAQKYIIKKMRQYQHQNLLVKKGSESRGFAIEHQGQLIGGIGFTDFKSTAEIGYWLAKTYWGQGIMSAVVRLFLKYLRKKYYYQAFQAKVFPFNTASMKVLQKNGFQFETRIVHNYKVGKRYFDDVVFIKTYSPKQN